MSSIMCLLCRKRINKLQKYFTKSVRFCETLNQEMKRKHFEKKSVLLPKSSYPFKHSRNLELNNDISLQNFIKLVDRSKMRGSFVLHDGPPYANGSLHFGHAINKFLKDMICRRKLLEGFEVSFLPGWDCHGLPIELKAISEDFETLNPIEIRQKAKQLAINVIDEQKTCFKKWGIIADWDNPYLTFDSVFVRNQINVFHAILEKGLIFRDKMPVYWSPTAQTALAEAELQYNDKHISKSVFVKFKLTNIPDSIQKFDEIYALIWTTTPWTLPANQAIAYSPTLGYSVVKINRFPDNYLLVADDLIQSLETILDSKIEIKQRIKGLELKGIQYINPIAISDEMLPFLESSHVITGKGTGLVHIAPNHGLDDYKLIMSNKIPLKQCIVDERGRYVSTSNPLLDNKFVLTEGNEIVMNLLNNSLLFQYDYIHSYPYDWRFNEPVIVRSSPQWFLNVEAIREDCIKALENVMFYPEFYKEYLVNQLRVRPNWCLSRQRSWGVPIPAFYHKTDHDFKTPIISKTILNSVLKQFEEKGCDVWWLSSVEELVPKHIIENEFKLSSDDLVKGKDIFDIWFDSGNSWNTALKEPKIADMYLEGYDQLRGWFQSSLIVSIALRNCSPYRSVKIHGFALDGNGKKMSKSIGNVIDPNAIIEDKTNPKNNCGSDGFRWWVARSASDHKDERVSLNGFDETLIDLNRIRLTLRFLIGSLSDFNASTDIRHLSEMNSIDRYLLHHLHHYLNDMQNSYNSYKFSQIIQKSNDFIANIVSALYVNRVRHRLYCNPKTSVERRSCQTVLFYLYNSIVFQLSPILPHIMIDANNHLPLNKEFVQNSDEWNQQNIVNDMSFVLSICDLIHKEFPEKHLIKYDCSVRTDDINCLNNLSLFQSESSSTDSDLCEILMMSSVNYNSVPIDDRDRKGIALNGCFDDRGYQLVITSANNYLCDRCRRYTALNRGDRLCLHCQQVLSIS